MMTILGLAIAGAGAGGFLLLFTGANPDLSLTLAKMPFGLWGWAVVAGIGLLTIMLNRRPRD
jgi:hypothetical protein